MANVFANTQLVTYETLYLLQPNLVLAGELNNDYSKQFGQEGNKVGSSINIRLPQQFIGRTGTSVNLESISDRTIPLSLTTQFGVDFQVTSADLKLSIDDVRGRYLSKAAVTIGNKINRDAATVISLTCPNIVGTPGTAITTEDIVRQATILLDENNTPLDDKRNLMINSRMEQSILTATKVQFNDQAELGRQYREGRMGKALGYSWYMSQATPRLTSGTRAGTPVIAGANQTGTTLNISGLTAATTIPAGGHFTIPGVYLVESISHIATPGLQEFVVMTTTAADGAGAATVSISPAILPTGQYQNVSAAPANGAPITWVGPVNVPYSEGIAFHRDSYTIAFAPLDKPTGVESATVTTDPKSGVSIRTVLFWNGMTDQWIYRFDTLYGIGPLYPQTACLLASN